MKNNTSNNNNKRNHSLDCRWTPTTQNPWPNLEDLHYWGNQKKTSQDGAKNGTKHHLPNRLFVEVAYKLFIWFRSIDKFDHYLQAMSLQWWCEKKRKGNNLKQHQAPDHDDIGIAAKTTINAMQPYSGEWESQKWKGSV